MPDPQRQYFGDLAASSYGVDDGRAPLVVLHGLTFDRHQWQPALDALQAIDPERRVLALDLPGHGDSPRLESYREDEVVAAVHQAVIEARIDSPIVVGHSRGAALATTYAATHLSRGVVTVDQLFLPGKFRQLLGEAEAVLGSHDYPDVLASLLMTAHTDLLPPSDRHLVRTVRTPLQDLLLGYWSELISCPEEALRSRRMHDLEAIRSNGTPCLHIAGEELDPGYRQWLESVLPKVAVTVLPGSGHFPHLARPTEFAQILADTR